MATLLPYPVDGFAKLPDEDFDTYLARTDRLLKDLLDRAKTLPDGELVGTVLSFGVADGKAMYLVVKTKPLTLQHIPYLDAYQIPDAHLRGIRLDDVKKQREFSKFWHNR